MVPVCAARLPTSPPQARTRTRSGSGTASLPPYHHSTTFETRVIVIAVRENHRSHSSEPFNPSPSASSYRGISYTIAVDTVILLPSDPIPPTSLQTTKSSKPLPQTRPARQNLVFFLHSTSQTRHPISHPLAPWRIITLQPQMPYEHSHAILPSILINSNFIGFRASPVRRSWYLSEGKNPHEPRRQDLSHRAPSCISN